MPILRVVTDIQSPPAVVFDLERSVDLHVALAGASQERAVGGVTSGLLGPGDVVTWSARHFGVRQELTSRITQFDPPHHFRDTLVRGAFRRFDHDHFFEATADGTRMIDVFDYEAPLGIFGQLAERVFLDRYMRRLLEERARAIRRVAESGVTHA